MTFDVAMQQAPATMAVAVSAAQARETAIVQARYVVAIQRPRSWEDVRSRALKEFSNPRLAANKSVIYSKPVGSERKEGPGIRMAEVLMRCAGNLYLETPMISSNDDAEIYCVSITDMETNFTLSRNVEVKKQVERSSPSSDGHYFSMRKNSKGKATYLVRATESDMLNIREAAISKATRNVALRMMPVDLIEDCMERVRQVRADSTAQDPRGALRNMLYWYETAGVTPQMLSEYLGRPVDSATVAEIEELNAICGSILDKETTWGDVMSSRSQDQPAAGQAQGQKLDERKPVSQERMTKLLQAASAKFAAPDADGVLASPQSVIAGIERVNELTSEQRLDVWRAWARVRSGMARTPSELDSIAAEMRAAGVDDAECQSLVLERAESLA
jgi:hypothetical protein